jgi:site-specific recombinase XerD
MLTPILSYRRTFVILSLRAGMNALTIPTLLGHEDLTMTKHYAEMVDDGLLQAHKQHSPVDNLK